MNSFANRVFILITLCIAKFIQNLIFNDYFILNKVVVVVVA